MRQIKAKRCDWRLKAWVGFGRQAQLGVKTTGVPPRDGWPPSLYGVRMEARMAESNVRRLPVVVGVFLALVVLNLPGALHAQVTGTISGYVTDPSEIGRAHV